MASTPPIPSAASSQQLGASGLQGMSKDASNQNSSVMNSHGYPQDHPIKPGTETPVNGSDTLKPPKAPQQLLSPFMRYSRKVSDEVKTANEQLKPREIGRIIDQMWRDLSDGDRQEFVEEYESEKIEHDRTLKAYQSYITAKSKARQEADEKETANEPGILATPIAPTKKQLKKARQKKKKEDALKKKAEKIQAKAPKTPSGSSDKQYRTDSDGFQANISYPRPKKPEVGKTPDSQAGPSPSTD